MKFLFVENRYKTYFWEAMAERLSRDHHVSWIVQNHAFIPRIGHVNVLPYPARSDMRVPDESADLAFIRRADRNINFFGGNDHHYAYYQEKINSCLEREQPDVVIGESTLFHELMVAAWCRRHGVRYLHPSMPGYPNGRFCIYEGDTKVPLGGCDDIPGDNVCLAMAEAISKREVMPDYMRPPVIGNTRRVHPVHRSLEDHKKLFVGYAKGERYNTPPPWRRMWRPIGVALRMRQWKRLVNNRYAASEGVRAVLYPMQMQPEANLDVWGNRYRDQATLVAEMADALPENYVLLVKANPKTKYEMSPGLIETIRSRRNIVPLPVDLSMAEAISRASLVVTVTGTVAIECALSMVPLVHLGPGVCVGVRGCESMSDLATLPEVVRCIEEGNFRLADEASRVELVRKLYRTSFPGLVSDPATLPEVTDRKNVERVVSNLLRVVGT